MIYIVYWSPFENPVAFAFTFFNTLSFYIQTMIYFFMAHIPEEGIITNYEFGAYYCFSLIVQ